MEKETVSISDVEVTGYKGDYIFETIRSTGDFYEASLLKKWTPLLGQPKYILDVGANIGNHSLYWATHLQPERITSFEPFPDNYALLSENVNNNHLSCVQPIQMAIGNKSGRVSVCSFDPENLGGTTFQYTDSGENTVLAAPLDLMAEALQITQLDFVKIDTEGFEADVLEGMEGLLKKFMPILWVEVGKDTILEVLTLTRTLNYRLADIEGANVLLLPPDAGPDMQVGENDLLVERFTLVDKVNTYYKNYETAKKWLDGKNQKIAILEKKNADLSDGLAASREQTKRAEQERDSLKSSLDAAEKERDGLKSSLDEAQQEFESSLAAAEKERDGIKSSLDEAQQEFKSSLAAAEQERDRLTGELQNANRDKNVAGAELHSVKQEREQLREKLQTAEKAQAALAGRLQGDAEELEREQAFLRKLKSQLQVLNAQLNQAQQQNRIYEEKLQKVYGTWYGRIVLRCYKVLKKIKHLLVRC